MVINIYTEQMAYLEHIATHTLNTFGTHLRGSSHWEVNKHKYTYKNTQKYKQMTHHFNQEDVWHHTYH